MADHKPVDLDGMPLWGWLLIFAFAIYGFVTFMNHVAPCRVRDGCDPTAEYDAADNQW